MKAPREWTAGERAELNAEGTWVCPVFSLDGADSEGKRPCDAYGLTRKQANERAAFIANAPRVRAVLVLARDAGQLLRSQCTDGTDVADVLDSFLPEAHAALGNTTAPNTAQAMPARIVLAERIRDWTRHIEASTWRAGMERRNVVADMIKAAQELERAE